MTQIDFDQNSPAYQVYSQLKNLGFKDEQIDRGYQTANHEIVGAHDNLLEAAEVYDTAMDEYTIHRENTDLKQIVEGFAGQLDFDGNSPAYQVYSQLKNLGFKNEQIDRGYQTSNQETVGAHDNLLEAAEVYGTALDEYTAHPENADLKQIVEGFAGQPIPWELTDDPTVVAKVTTAINQIDTILKKEGLTKDKPEYQERMAVALFYFCLFPDDLNFIRENRDELLDLTKELSQTLLFQTDLPDFQKILFNQGGLGVFLFDGDAPLEAPALEALKTKKGACTEQSNILYAVYQLAGLNSFFVKTNLTDMEEVLAKQGISIPDEIRSNGHEYIGVSLGEHTRFFDLNQRDSDANYPVYDRENLLRHLSGFRNNSGYDLFNSNDPLDVKIYQETLAIELDPTNDAAYNNLGLALFGQGKLDEAEEALKKAIQLNDRRSQACYNLGMVLEKEGKLEEAAQFYNQAVTIDPKNASAHYYLGIYLYHTENFDEAVTAFRQAVQIDPQFTDAYYNLAYTLLADEKDDEAFVLLNEGIANPAIRDSFVKLSYVLAQKNWLKQALTFVEPIIKADAYNTQAYLVSSYIFFKQDKPAEGKRFLQKVIQLDPDHQKNIKQMALETSQRGDMATAISLLKANIHLDHSDSDSPYELGALLLQQNKPVKAKSEFRKSLRRDPSNQQRRQELDKLMLR